MSLELENFIQKFAGVSEEYRFYNDEITLRYYDKEHAYFLLKEDGSEERQDGVTTICHIIDKSNVLIAWGVKMMQQKLLITVPGTRTSGVTVMTDVELEDWVAKGKSAHKEKLEEAGAIGSTAHNWIEQYIKLTIAKDVEGRQAHRANMPSDDRAKKACEAALEWMRQHNVRWRLTEQKIYSRKHKYAGTMDGLCVCDSCDNPKCCPNEFKDRLTIADWKTSNYLYLEYLLQTAAYMQAYNEQVGYLNHVHRLDPSKQEAYATDRWVIRLGKDDGEFEPWHLEEHTFQEDFDGFELCLDLTRRVASLEARIKERKDNLKAALKAEKDERKAAKALVEAQAKAERKAERERERLEARTAKESAKQSARDEKLAAKQAKAESEKISMLEDILGARSNVTAHIEK